MNSHNALDYHWVIISAFLVFMMQLGFAMVETGCVRSKNTINVAMKNLADTTFGFFFFWLIGFGLMFGQDSHGLSGTTLFMIDGKNNEITSFFFFQAMFATTAATIVSGAVAERMKFNGYVFIAILVTTFIYPIFGHWAWGNGGWLKSIGFTDFAGSTVVHSVGAWVGLAGALVLGPRLGKFHHATTRYFAPSNHNFIVFGVLILWFAWFGFNAGSLLSFGPTVSSILLNTLISGASGGICAYLISLLINRLVNVEVFSFGIIAGLVGITAGCAQFNAPQAVFVGGLSAIIMCISERILLKLHIDDPLSVVAIHGCVGIWGTMAVGFFGSPPGQLTRLEFIFVQGLGVSTAFILSFSCGILLFYLLKQTNALRVSPKDEVLGLNITEHQARLPWVETIESIIRIMRSGNMYRKIHEERGTEVGVVARFFNYLLGILHHREVELISSNKSLKSQAHLDTLTKTLNRRGFQNKVALLKTAQKTFSIIIFDIDHFKKINDSFGHAAGDSVLEELAELVNCHLTKEDIFARWGGEEFVILLPLQDEQSVLKKAELLRKIIATHHFALIGSLTCSFGVANFSQAEASFEQAFEEADNALYRAKNSGRNQVCYN